MKQSANAHVPRFYVASPLAADSAFTLQDAQAHHLRKVLRARLEDPVRLFNGDGFEHDARITCIGNAGVELAITQSRRVASESPLRLVLAQAIVRGDRMDQAIAKAVELGVNAVAPVFTERAKLRLNAERAQKKQTHWQRVAISAAEQSGRVRVPEVLACQQLKDFLKSPPTAVGLVLDPGADKGLGDCARAAEATLLVGPESGLSAPEIEQATRAGFSPVRFGPRVLRTETAGPACLAALQTLWGDLA